MTLVLGDVTTRSDPGSISRSVRKDVSLRSSLAEVTDKKMSTSFCWSARAVPFRSSICSSVQLRG